MFASSILACAEAFGDVTEIQAPTGQATAVAGELEAAERADLAALVVEGAEAHRMIVVAGGVPWPFGGY